MLRENTDKQSIKKKGRPSAVRLKGEVNKTAVTIGGRKTKRKDFISVLSVKEKHARSWRS